MIPISRLAVLIAFAYTDSRRASSSSESMKDEMSTGD
jgi:hypothetical protein